MGKAVKKVGIVVGAVALVATGVGALAGAGLLGANAAAVAGMSGAWSIAGVSVQTLARVGLGMAFLGSATSKPLKVGTAAGSPTDFAADPNAPIPLAFGRTGTAGRIIHATTGEEKNRNALYATVLSLGPIHGAPGFKANGEAVTFGPLQQAIGGTFANRMWMNIQLGATPSPPFGPPNTLDPGVLAEWTTDHKLSGLAAAWYVRDSDQKTYPTGTPQPLWTIEGVFAWDPRLDDTYPGGVGDCRRDNPATWVFSKNPFINGLTWCRGYYQNGVRVMGIGARDASIDIAAFVEAANVADANGWEVGGVVYSSDSKWDVLKALCQAGGGRPLQLPASITVLVNAPREAIATLTEDDLCGPYTVPAVSSVRNRPNQIIPKYRSPDHDYEITAAGPVKVSAYIAIDGRLRSREVQYPLVQDAKQVAQLAAYDLVNARELGPASVSCKPHWRHYKRGDCIMVQCPRTLGMDGMKCIILGRDLDPMTGDVTLTIQSETDAKHDFALGRTADPPPVPALHGVSAFLPAPATGRWTASAVYLEGADGSKQPAIVVEGSVDDQNASGVIIDYRPIGRSWSAVERPATATRIEIAPVIAGETYELRVRYRSVKGLEDPTVYRALGTVTVGALISSDTVKFGDLIAADLTKAVENVRNAQLEIEKVRAGAQVEIDAILKKLNEAIDGKPLAPVIKEHKEVITSTLVQVGENKAAIEYETLARETAISSEAYARLTLASNFDTFSASATQQFSTITTNLDATSALTNSLNTDYSGFKASANTALLAHSNGIEALTISQTQLATTVGNNKASADQSIQTLTNTTTSLSSAQTSLANTVASNKASADSSISSLVSQQGSTALSLQNLNTDYLNNKASVSTSLTTLSNTQGAQATTLSNLGVTVGGHTSSISSIQTVQSNLSGKVSAIVALKLDVNGKVIGVQYANDGSTGAITFNADYVQIDGDLIVNGSFTASKLASGAANPTAYSDANWTVAGSNSQIVLLTHDVYMEKSGRLKSVSDIAMHFPSGDRTWDLQLWIDGTKVSHKYGANGADSITLSGSKAVGQGSRNVTVLFTAPPQVNIDYRNLDSIGTY